MRIIKGNCLEQLKTLEDNSIDSIVTDPPYGLSFMGKKWDYDVPSQEIWEEVLRVLKPGGYLLSFAGTRTYHRMAVRIEDAGFEIRDMISWIYGSGFPKSLNIGKAVDKLQGNEREEYIDENFLKRNPISNHKDDFKESYGNPSYKDGIDGAKRTKGASEWEGWGTALKPAHEPICMARKPLSEKTVAKNVLKYGTGGINIDESRVDYNGEVPNVGGRAKHTRGDGYGFKELGDKIQANQQGRFPANLILDEEAGKMLDEQSGVSGSNKQIKLNRKRKGFMLSGSENNIQEANSPDQYGDKGGASRFFYCAKASKSERNKGMDNLEAKPMYKADGSAQSLEIFGSTDGGREDRKNNHPTVKPIALMEYLIKMVTPKGGIVLDPFMGSGSTGVAAIKNNFDFIGIEMEEEYIKIAEARINNTKKDNKLL